LFDLRLIGPDTSGGILGRKSGKGYKAKIKIKKSKSGKEP
jgi:hypothetical protein